MCICTLSVKSPSSRACTSVFPIVSNPLPVGNKFGGTPSKKKNNNKKKKPRNRWYCQMINFLKFLSKLQMTQNDNALQRLLNVYRIFQQIFSNQRKTGLHSYMYNTMSINVKFITDTWVRGLVLTTRGYMAYAFSEWHIWKIHLSHGDFKNVSTNGLLGNFKDFCQKLSISLSLGQGLRSQCRATWTMHLKIPYKSSSYMYHRTSI